MGKRASPLDIYALLDKSNCKECGYDTCMAFATDLLERKIGLDDCTHLKKTPKKLAKLRSLTSPPQKPVVIGVGDRKITVGGEEVLMRHQLTFYNSTGIFVEVSDDLGADLDEIVKYLTDVKIERMGDVLRIGGIALRCVSGSADTFKAAAKKIAGMSDLPIILCSLNADNLLAAEGEIKDKKPLLYAATKDNWEKVGTFAVQNNLPVAVTSTNMDDLVSLSATLQKLGAKEIVLDPGTFYGPGKLAVTYDKIMQLRTAAIDFDDANACWPVMGVPAAYWAQVDTDGGDLWRHQYQEIIMGSIMVAIDTSLIIIHTGQKKDEIWALMALLTLCQTIFADPRIYPAVDPGCYKIGDPKEDAPIFVTCNYRMTKIPVEQDLQGGNIDCWLLVVDSEGIGIESAVAGGQFNAGTIAEAANEFKAFDNVNHRILILPGMSARLSGALEDEANCYVLVGPRDSSGIPKFVEDLWRPERFMAEFNERGD